MSLAQRRQLVDRDHRSLSIARQCALLGVSRSSLYYRPKGASDDDLDLMQAMDRQYLETPFYGSRRMRAWLGPQVKYMSRTLSSEEFLTLARVLASAESKRKAERDATPR